MKTPMQELISEMEKSPLMFASALALIEEMRMIEKEKEYFMAYGFSCCLMTKQKNDWSLEALFNEHFNTKEK